MHSHKSVPVSLTLFFVAQFQLFTKPLFCEWFLSVRHNDIRDKSLPMKSLCFSGKERQITDAFAENNLRHRVWPGVAILDKMSLRR